MEAEIDPTEAIRRRLEGSILVSRSGQGDSYRLERVVEEGELGAFCHATDVLLGVKVSVLVLSPSAARSDHSFADFLAEAQLLAEIDHPNLVRWLAFDQTAEGVRYLVYERLEPYSLEELLNEDEPLQHENVVRILLQVLDALQEVHETSAAEFGRPLLHLDLKPANVLLMDRKADTVKVAAWGLSRHFAPVSRAVTAFDLRGEDLYRIAPTPLVEDEHGRLREIEAGGTLPYAAPELCARLAGDPNGEPLGPSTDLYALGVMAFRLLTGGFPWRNLRDGRHVIENHESVVPMGLEGFARVPRRLRRFIERALEKDPARRFPDAAAAADYLRPLVDSRRRKRNLVAGIGALLLVGAGSWVAVDASGARQAVASSRAWFGGWFTGERTASERDLAEAVPAAELGSKDESASATPPGPVAIELAPAVLEGAALSAADEGRTTEASFVPEEAAAPTGFAFPAAAAHERWLGPARPRVVLPLPEDAGLPDVLGQDVRLTLHATSSEVLEGWTVEPAVGGVALVGTDALATDSFDLEVELATPDARWRSDAVTLSWLGSDAWKIARTTPESGATLASKTETLTVQLDVSEPARAFGPDVFEGVWLTRGETLIELRAVPSVPYAFAVELAELFGESARIDGAELVVRDRSGRVERRPWNALIELGPVHCEALALAGSSALRGAFTVTEDIDELVARFDRPVDVTWRLYEEGGEALLEGGATETLALAAPIDFFTLAKGRSFTGRIELEALAVDRGSELLRTELVLRYLGRTPDFGLVFGQGEVSRPLSPDEIVFTNRTAMQLSFERDSRVVSEVEVSRMRVDERNAKAETTTLRADETSLSIELAEDGVYRFVAAPVQVDPGGGRQPWTEGARTFLVVLDRTPAELAVEDGRDQEADSAPFSLEHGASPLVTVRASGETREFEAWENPLDVRWKLVHSGLRVIELATGELEPVRPSSPVQVLLSDLIDAPDALQDGELHLIFFGRDRASGAETRATLEWSVARRGPELALAGPLEPVWQHDGRGWFELEVNAEDANGVATLVCRLVHPDEPERSFEFPLASDAGSQPRADRWSGRVRLGAAWSEREVRWGFHAVDGKGNAVDWKPDTGPERFAAIAPTLAKRLEFTRRGAPARIAPMRLVSGNEDGTYLFGGRGDDVENTDFRVRYGLASFDTKARMRSWMIPYRPGEIASYYLDEREVSVGEFRAFLEATDGFLDPRHWPTGAEVPSESRRDQLLTALAPRRRDLPVAGVDWNEASAYAAWVGKRLPTFVEWEFAVRGGTDYRPFSAADTGAGPPDARVFNYDPNKEFRGAPVAVGSSADRTSGTGLFELCSNVSEWTSTPHRFEPRLAAESMAEHMRTSLREASAPKDELATAGQFWIVGGNYESSGFDFSNAREGARERRDPTVGFRCAVSAAFVLNGFHTWLELGIDVNESGESPASDKR